MPRKRRCYPKDRRFRIWIRPAVLVGIGVAVIAAVLAAWIELADAVRNLIPRRYPTLNKDDSRVIVIEAGSKLLGHMNSEMAQIALQELKNAGVGVWLNATAKNVGNGNIETEAGQSISAATVVWATGIRASTVVSELKTDHGKAARSR